MITFFQKAQYISRGGSEFLRKFIHFWGQGLLRLCIRVWHSAAQSYDAVHLSAMQWTVCSAQCNAMEWNVCSAQSAIFCTVCSAQCNVLHCIQCSVQSNALYIYCNLMHCMQCSVRCIGMQCIVCNAVYMQCSVQWGGMMGDARDAATQACYAPCHINHHCHHNHHHHHHHHNHHNFCYNHHYHHHQHNHHDCCPHFDSLEFHLKKLILEDNEKSLSLINCWILSLVNQWSREMHFNLVSPLESLQKSSVFSTANALLQQVFLSERKIVRST